MLDKIARRAKPCAPTLVRCLWGPPLAPGQCDREASCAGACSQRSCIQQITPRAFTSAPVGEDVQTHSAPFHRLLASMGGRQGTRPKPFLKTTNEGHRHATSPDPVATQNNHHEGPSFLTCFGVPHTPRAGCALRLLVFLGTRVPNTSGTIPKTASRGGIALGRGALGSSPVKFSARVGTHGTDPRKQIEKGNGHTQCRIRSAKENPPHTT